MPGRALLIRFALIPAVLLAVLSSVQWRAAGPVVEACIKLADHAGLAGQEVRARCACTDRVAKRYLDPDNYAVLERASKALLAPDRELPDFRVAIARRAVKLEALDVATAAGDFAMLVHKVDSQCVRGED